MFGIIGGIGSGKSLVARLMMQHGGYLISADPLWPRGLAAAGHPAATGRQRQGNDILDDQGNVDRQKLGRIVFAQAADLRALEALVFPYIEARIREEADRARGEPDVKFIILDAAIMLETGWHRLCDKIVFVDTPRPLRLARLQEQRGWNDKELERREKAQMPLEEKKGRADVVIVNDAAPDKVARQVQDALEQWKVI